MKKLLSRRGFTLVEVMVAFVIFAIMAGMVAVILNSTMAAKRENTALEEEIAGQQANYYLSDHDMTYNASNKAGTIVLDFKGSDSVSFDYAMEEVGGGSEGSVSLGYVVGDAKYDAEDDGNADIDNDGNLIDALDSRIFGTNKIEKVYLKCQDLGEVTSGHRYMFSIMVSAPDIENNDRYFAQVRLRFAKEDANGEMINIRVLDYGYIGTGNSIENKNVAGTKDYNVTSPSFDTIRIGSNMPSGAWGDKKQPMLSATYKSFWVTLDNTISADDLNEAFGYSNNENVPAKSGDTYVFTPYEERVIEGGVEKVEKTHCNIFGAFPKKAEKPETPGSGTDEADPTSETTEP